MLNKLEKLSQDIKYIVEGKPHRTNFIYDAAQEGKVTVNSVQEALTGCAAEDLGICTKLTRAAEREYDFLDSLGNKWDVKIFAPHLSLKNKKNFDYARFVLDIKDEILKGEKILLNITDTNDSYLIILREHMNNLLSKEDIQQIYFINYKLVNNNI